MMSVLKLYRLLKNSEKYQFLMIPSVFEFPCMHASSNDKIQDVLAR